MAGATWPRPRALPRDHEAPVGPHRHGPVPLVAVVAAALDVRDQEPRPDHAGGPAEDRGLHVHLERVGVLPRRRAVADVLVERHDEPGPVRAGGDEHAVAECHQVGPGDDEEVVEQVRPPVLLPCGPHTTGIGTYGPHLYVCPNAGVVTCYEAATGAEVYRERIGGTSYTASPVAADGRLYFVSEQGEVRVVKAGAEFELLAVNKLDDVCLATPPTGAGALHVRTQRTLSALGCR